MCIGGSGEGIVRGGAEGILRGDSEGVRDSCEISHELLSELSSKSHTNKEQNLCILLALLLNKTAFNTQH